MKKFAILALPFVLFADEDILNKSQKNILETKEKIIIENRKINEKSWLSNLGLNLSVNEDNDKKQSKNIALSYEQNIFKFGAIGYSIDLAKLKEQYDLLDLKVDYKSFLNIIYTGVLEIKKQEIEIQKIKLELKNQTIAIKIKQEEYKEGQADIISLNDKIIAKSSLEKSLVNSQISLQNSIDELKKYSNINYDEIKIPDMKIINLDDFLASSDELSLARQNANIANLTHKITKTDFLPKLSFTLNGGFLDNNEKNYDKYYNYGLKISMPFDFSYANKIEKSRLNYLLANEQKIQIKTQEQIEFKKISQEIQKFQKLIKIATKDIKLYAQLLEVAKQELQAGYKSAQDVEILSNTKNTRELDIKLYNQNIKQQILKYYY